jgi:hypothetical protein
MRGAEARTKRAYRVSCHFLKGARDYSIFLRLLFTIPMDEVKLTYMTWIQLQKKHYRN